MSITLRHPDAEVHIDESADGKRRISVSLLNKSRSIPAESWETSYPVELIQLILEVKGPIHLCDEIMRDESPSYVQLNLKTDILGYMDESDFVKKTILDFGCGCGASTLVLARLFPETRIIGTDLVEDFIPVARARAQHYGFSDLMFLVSPGGDQLPEEIGGVDFVVLSAVYEHLLPEERQTVIPLIWSVLKPGGVLFLDETPNRYFFLETHTTGLPLLNYLPDHLALVVSRKFSRRIGVNESWEMLLRRGVRGGTETEIMGILRRNSHPSPLLLEPCRLGFHDRIDLWYALSTAARSSTTKRLLRVLFKIIKYSTGITFVPYLALAIRKPKGM